MAVFPFKSRITKVLNSNYFSIDSYRSWTKSTSYSSITNKPTSSSRPCARIILNCEFQGPFAVRISKICFQIFSHVLSRQRQSVSNTIMEQLSDVDLLSVPIQTLYMINLEAFLTLMFLFTSLADMWERNSRVRNSHMINRT